MQYSKTVTTTVTLDTLPIGSLIAVKQAKVVETTKVSVKNRSSTTTKHTSEEHLVTPAVLKSLKSGTTSVPYNKTNPFLLTPAIRAVLRKEGYDAFRKLQDSSACVEAQTPYSYLAAGGEAVLAFDDYGSHTVSLEDGTQVAQMLQGNYLNGGFDESRYDLTKAAGHLLQRPDVVLFCVDSRGRGGRVATTLEEAISSVPYYNAEEGRNLGLYFTWHPDQATFDTLTPHRKHPYEQWEAVFAADALGLRAAGAALFDVFHKATTY